MTFSLLILSSCNGIPIDVSTKWKYEKIFKDQYLDTNFNMYIYLPIICDTV